MFSLRLIVTAAAITGFASAAIACPMHKSHDQNAQSPMPTEQQTAQSTSEPEAKPAEKQAAEATTAASADKKAAQVASNPAPTVK